MQIDWITVAAQIINFVVLLWLLKRFLYGPIIRAMDRREVGIAERIVAAEERERAAEAAVRDYQTRTREFEVRRERMIEEAEAAAEKERQRLLAAAREEVAEERRLWLNGVQADRTEFMSTLNETAATEICAIARKVVADLARSDLEPLLVAAFVDRLEAIDDDERRKIAEAAAEADGPVTVLSSTELPRKLRDKLRQALQAVLGHEAHIRFLTDTSATLGIRVTAGSRTLAWSIDSYMDQLEHRVAEEIESLAPERTEG